MYDSVFLRLSRHEASGVDFLEETPYYLSNVSEHHFKDGIALSGTLNGLKVSISEGIVKIKDGSLCKYYLGDNLQTLTRKDAGRAIEKLSDSLHLPMGKASVTRLDLAQNLIMKHPVDVYLHHLGTKKGSTRLEEPTGLYYNVRDGRLCFYDKLKECKQHREEIPELYQGKNVLRIEQRYLGRIAKHLNVEEVLGNTLADEAFYISLLDNWKEAYYSIEKVNDVELNFNLMKTKKQLYQMGVLALIQQAGGVVPLLTSVSDACKVGEISPKQAHDLRNAIKQAQSIQRGAVVPSESIKELDKKVSEAIKFYR